MAIEVGVRWPPARRRKLWGTLEARRLRMLAPSRAMGVALAVPQGRRHGAAMAGSSKMPDETRATGSASSATGSPSLRLAGIQDAADARVPVVDENEMARYLEGWGRRIVEHRGRPWEEVVRGFYRPVNLFARLSSLEATRPTWRCWGFQACLREDQAHQANAALPVHRLRDFDCVTEDALPSSRRYKLRKARRLVEFVALTRADLLLHEG